MINEIKAEKFIDACLKYDKEKIISLIKQGCDPFSFVENDEDFLYCRLLNEFMYLPTESENSDVSIELLPKLTKLFYENGMNNMSIEKYVFDGNHPTPYWMLAFLDFNDAFRETVEIMVENEIAVREFEELVDHFTLDFALCYDETEYGAPGSEEFNMCLREIMWFTSFTDILVKAEWFKTYIGYREDFDYTQFKNIYDFSYKYTDPEGSPVSRVNGAKIEVFNKNNEKIYEFILQ